MSYDISLELDDEDRPISLCCITCADEQSNLSSTNRYKDTIKHVRKHVVRMSMKTCCQNVHENM